MLAFSVSCAGCACTLSSCSLSLASHKCEHALTMNEFPMIKPYLIAHFSRCTSCWLRGHHS